MWWLCLIALMLTGCKTTQTGGSAVQQIPTPVTQMLVQPENPEGPSNQQFVRVTQQPDGTIITERATTQLGGSQSMADILKASGISWTIKGVLTGIVLLLAGIVAVARGWPVTGLWVGIGGVASMLSPHWWLGLVSVAAAFLIYHAYMVRNP
jgi:hypothetical protein